MPVINKGPSENILLVQFKNTNFGRIWIYSTISFNRHIRDFL